MGVNLWGEPNQTVDYGWLNIPLYPHEFSGWLRGLSSQVALNQPLGTWLENLPANDFYRENNCKNYFLRMIPTN